MKVLVVASTFPASDTDSVPAFVKEQIIAMKKYDPSLEFSVLAPHDIRSHTVSFSQHKAYDEYRFRYAWPHSIEKLAGHGIMPALEKNAFNYLLVVPLFVGEFIALLHLTIRLKPDVIYAHWFTPQAIICRFVTLFTRTPYVFTTHASDVSVWHKVPLLGKPMVRFATSGARAFTAVSDRSMQKLKAFFDDVTWNTMSERQRILPMGVSIEPVNSTQDINPDLILFIGRLAEKKGVQYLLPAFKQLLIEHPNTKLTIAGDGPWQEKLSSQATELAITNSVKFTGYITGKKKKDLLQTAHILVVPSIETKSGDAEGLPVALMEGLVAGKICIATNESGADNILTDKKDGFLIPQKDERALSQSLQEALDLSATQRQKMVDEATKTAKQFSWDKIAKDHYDFLFKEDRIEL